MKHPHVPMLILHVDYIEYNNIFEFTLILESIIDQIDVNIFHDLDHALIQQGLYYAYPIW